MITRLRLSLALLTTLVLSACDDAPRFTHAEPGEALSAGSATVRKSDQNAFSMPSANLSPCGGWTSVSVTAFSAARG